MEPDRADEGQRDRRDRTVDRIGGLGLDQTRATLFSGAERIGRTICKRVFLEFHLFPDDASCGMKECRREGKKKEAKIRWGRGERGGGRESW